MSNLQIPKFTLTDERKLDEKKTHRLRRTAKKRDEIAENTVFRKQLWEFERPRISWKGK